MCVYIIRAEESSGRIVPADYFHLASIPLSLQQQKRGFLLKKITTAGPKQ